MRIGILTGGGDVPGLDRCIQSVVDRVADHGHEVLGIQRGWGGLLACDPDDPQTIVASTRLLDRAVVSGADRSNGSLLHTSRINPGRIARAQVPPFLADDATGEGPFDLTAHVLTTIDALGLDVLIPIGGDDTLSYARRLHDEQVPVVAIPKTMDNDVPGTDYCIGFSTAVSRSVGFLGELRVAAGSHERLAVVELFGRQSGETCLVSAYLAGVDRAIIPEVPFDVDRLAAMLVEDKRRNPGNYALMAISEGATTVGGALRVDGDNDGHGDAAGIAAVTGELLRQRTGEGLIVQRLGYLMRTGRPDSLDLMVAANYGVAAGDLAVGGSNGRLVALRSGTYTSVPLSDTAEAARRVDIDALYEVESYRPKVRDVEGLPMFLY